MPVQEARPLPMEEKPIDLIHRKTRFDVSRVLNAAKEIGSDMGILKPHVLNGNQVEPEVSYHMHSGQKVLAHLESAPRHLGNDVVFINPKNDAFAIIHGEGEETRLAAAEYGKAFDKYENLLQAQYEANKVIEKHKIRGNVSFSYAKIIEGENDEKYLWKARLGDGATTIVYDEYGADKKPEESGLIRLETGDRIVMISKEMGLSSDDIFGLMLHPGGKLKSVRTLTENIKKYAQERGCSQAFIVMDIK